MNLERYVVHVPGWLRWMLLAVLGLLVLGFSVSFFAGLGRPGYSDWSSAAVSVVQIALTGLAYIALMFFTETAHSPHALQAKTEYLLTRLVPERLGRITDIQGQLVTVRVQAHDSGIIGRGYELASANTRLKMWVGINVRRAIVIYFCSRPEELDDGAFDQRLRTVFRDTILGAEAVGYDPPHVQLERIDGEAFASIWLSWDLIKAGGEADFLIHGPNQLFFAQDVALMTQSFLRSAQRAGLTLWTRLDPMPL